MGDMYRQKFSCEICHKTFTRKYSLSRHYKEVHQGESRSSKFQCKFQKDNNEKPQTIFNSPVTIVHSMDKSYLYLTLTALGPSLLAIERTVNDPSRLLNDFGVPSLNRVPFANPNLSTDPGNC